MSKKGAEAAAEKLEKFYSQYPDWYWKFGLHDAVILSVSESELQPNYKEKHHKRNCLEILLDSTDALYETNVQKISLYNYRIVGIKKNASEPLTLEAFRDIYWSGDSIEQSEDGRYLLEIEFIDLRGDLMHLTVRFDTAEIERR